MTIDPQPSSRVHSYLQAVGEVQIPGLGAPTAIILFGSAATGAFSEEASDVDLIVVVPDQATPGDRAFLREALRSMEIAHGFRLPPGSAKNHLEKFAEHAGGQALSSFICTRSDLLSGDVARVFSLRAVEKLFVDRIVLASVLVSARTICGEDLLPRVSVPPVRRLDVFKALFGFTGLLILCTAAFPLLPDATKYAIGTLKHSLHSCFFCYHLSTASLEEEIVFFGSLLGRIKVFVEVLEKRRKYTRSFGFVLRCFPILFRLHIRTALDNHFPRAVTRTYLSNC